MTNPVAAMTADEGNFIGDRARWGVTPCNCLVPSTICSMPSTCASESWPPEVLVGNVPSMRNAPERQPAALAPFRP